MPRYDVTCSEVRIFSWTVEDIEAESEEQAEDVVQKMYQNGELHMMGGDEETEDGLHIDDVRVVEEV